MKELLDENTKLKPVSTGSESKVEKLQRKSDEYAAKIEFLEKQLANTKRVQFQIYFIN
jgi:hypothetical protein